MSIERTGTSWPSPAPTTECFYCYAAFKRGEPIIHWMGNGAKLWLHPGCVVDLTIRLMRDVHQVQCLTRAKFGPGGR